MGIFSLLVIVGIVLILVKVVLPMLLEGKQGYPYAKETLFSPAERSFLGVLDKVVGDNYRVLGKVRLADIIKVKSGLDQQTRRTAFNQIQSKHIDFVLCDPKDLDVKLAVELDDTSHNAEDRKNRDNFVDQALSAAGIGIVRIKAKKAYTLKEVESAIFERKKDEEE